MIETPSTPSETVAIAQPSAPKTSPTEPTETAAPAGDSKVVDRRLIPSGKPPVAPTPLKI